MNNPRVAQFRASAESVLHYLLNEYAKLQTGRANAALIENVDVEAYGQRQPLKSLAGISVTDARSIAVQPWDRSVLANVEKALQAANVGANPVNDGVLIRLNFQPMTEERRVQLSKVVHQLAEEARISIRKNRQEAHDAIKPEKDEDVRETLLEQLQKDVDEFNAKIAETAKKKEQEIMTI
ncbi:ribosome recycling factor [Candidatus Peribacteria bacterium RIFCSPHIGHO2_02_FULL_52_16]|nr:MAG: ribosome recycling factor [Candidatus Peribacteria bacterium RIFCSPHIGHO2_01_FULL_51_35]OGJ61661.1 MAG: ribosome recycling factor [Candidatus Peribacteria bacterium RIFCSPHIGHO2_02_FULL_52_16]